MAHQLATNEQLDTYLKLPRRKDRISLVRRWASDGIHVPLSFCQDLLTLNLSTDEHIGLIEACDTHHKLAFEFWMFEKIQLWNQDVAGAALRAWAAKTDCLLWHRLLPILRIPGLPQRIRYAILDFAPRCAGPEIVEIIVESEGWEDFSPAFHGLLFDRGIRFDVKSQRLTQMAWRIFANSQAATHSDDKSLLPACAWLMRHEEKKFKKMISETMAHTWKKFVDIASDAHSDRKKVFERLSKRLTKSGESNATSIGESVLHEWPSPWSRQDTGTEVVEPLVNMGPKLADRWLPGTPPSMVLGALQKADSRIIMDWASSCAGQLPWRGMRELMKGMVSQEKLNPTCAALAAEEGDPLNKERSLFQSTSAPFSLHSQLSQNTVSALYYGGSENSAPVPPPSTASEIYFAVARGEKLSSVGDGFWSKLTVARNNPQQAKLQDLATESRKQGGISTICYISTLGRMKGNDEAVLKILDHIRTSEEEELRAVVRALGDIDTGRSLQELIAVITRPNATPAVQQEAAAILARKDVSSLQKELRAAIQDLRIPEDSNSPVAEVREQLVALVQTDLPQAVTKGPGANKIPNAHRSNDAGLDEELSGMIPNYRELSSEVCRALRTALFFNRSITNNEAANAIDLSPLIDMQYKAMELLFREMFEEAVTQALHRGGIQRKLDVIGYARPVIRSMDDFENYISSLPVVREIPFFSKFKLRKMLRAICQFQPGRRFTLDGLKAFGLFFLCFGRTECRFGLNNLFPIGTKDDRELAEFCRELHVFQDFRNRAAHEGFHPSASNDIQGIWRTTALLVQWAFRVRESVNSPKSTVHKKVS